MATTAWPALGTTIGIDESYPPSNTFTNIGQVTSITGAGGGEVGERETTNLASSVKTFQPTIPDNGECSIELNYDPTDNAHKFLWALKDSPPTGSGQSFLGTNNFKVAFSTGNTNSSKVFPGFVKTIDGANAEGPDENLTASVSVRVAGAVTSLP
jgi:hypothetical protein